MTDELEVKQDMPVSDAVDTAWENVWDNPDAITFSQLEAVDTVGDLCDDLCTLGMVYSSLVRHVNMSETVTDKYAAIKTVTDEYKSRLDGLISEYSTEKSIVKKALDLFKEAPFKTEMGKKFHSSDYAYVPDAKKPSTWKLRLAETPGTVTVAQLGRAAAAFSSGGFRGNKVQMPSGSMGGAKAKIRAAYKRLGVGADKMPNSVKESGMMVWKEDAGYRIVASYSNAYRDDDKVPEIISSESNKEYVRKVDAGELPMPVFIHWHLKGTEYGVADWLNFDEDNLTITAVGHVIPGHEKEAEILAARSDISTSHGMPEESIVRDGDDPTIIKQHVTVEISDLPAWAAANQLSTYQIFKESEDMAIPEVKKSYLRELGLSDDQITKIEEMNSGVKAAATQEHRESKENTEATPTQEVKTTEPVAAPVVKETEPVVSPVTAESVAKAVADVLNPLAEMVKSFGDRLTAMENKEKEKPAMDLTPSASLSALIAQNMTSIGSKESRIRSDNPLAKSGPVETEAEETKEFDMPSAPLIGGVINDIITRKNGKK